MLRVERVTKRTEPIFAIINTLYEKAFPLHEQRTYQGRLATLSLANYHLSAWFDEE